MIAFGRQGAASRSIAGCRVRTRLETAGRRGLVGHELPQTGPGKAQRLGQAQGRRHGPGGLAPSQVLHQGPTAAKYCCKRDRKWCWDPRIAGLESRGWHLGVKVSCVQVVPRGIAV